MYTPVADQEFPAGGGGWGGADKPEKGEGANLLFGVIFAESCMKMKKNWTGGRWGVSLDQPLYTVEAIIKISL